MNKFLVTLFIGWTISPMFAAPYHQVENSTSEQFNSTGQRSSYQRPSYQRPSYQRPSSNPQRPSRQRSSGQRSSNQPTYYFHKSQSQRSSGQKNSSGQRSSNQPAYYFHKPKGPQTQSSPNQGQQIQRKRPHWQNSHGQHSQSQRPQGQPSYHQRPQGQPSYHQPPQGQHSQSQRPQGHHSQRPRPPQNKGRNPHNHVQRPRPPKNKGPNPHNHVQRKPHKNTPSKIVYRTPTYVISPVRRVHVIPEYAYGFYNGYWVPCYQGWYYYNDTWYWGSTGNAPEPPSWKPDPNRPVPPPQTDTAYIPEYNYDWYQGCWVPSYQGWYYYYDVWCWGGTGDAPDAPTWKPDPGRPVPPQPAIPEYTYNWYYGQWVPCYQEWYYYKDVWYWGGTGKAPDTQPRWKPDPNRTPPARPSSGPPKEGIGAPPAGSAAQTTESAAQTTVATQNKEPVEK